MRPAAQHPPAGFTLVEVMLAAAIAVTVAAVIVLLYGSVSRNVAGQRVRVDGRVAAERAAAAIRDDAARALLQEEDLACIVSLAPAPEGSALSWCVARAADGEDGLSWARTFSVQYRATPAADGIALVQIEKPLTGPGSLGPAVTNVLVPRLAEFTARLFDGSDWHEAWPPEGGKATPRLVRIRIVPAGETGTRAVESDFILSSGIVVTSTLIRTGTAAPPPP